MVSAVWIADCWWGEGESEGVAEGSRGEVVAGGFGHVEGWCSLFQVT